MSHKRLLLIYQGSTWDSSCFWRIVFLLSVLSHKAPWIQWEIDCEGPLYSLWKTPLWLEGWFLSLVLNFAYEFIDGILKLQRMKMLRDSCICFNMVILLPQDFQLSLPSLPWNRHTPVDFSSVFPYTALLNFLQVQQGAMKDRLTIFLHTLAWAWTLFVSTEDRRLSSETVQTGVFCICCSTELSRQREFQCEYFSVQSCYIESLSF